MVDGRRCPSSSRVEVEDVDLVRRTAACGCRPARDRDRPARPAQGSPPAGSRRSAERLVGEARAGEEVVARVDEREVPARPVAPSLTQPCLASVQPCSSTARCTACSAAMIAAWPAPSDEPVITVSGPLRLAAGVEELRPALASGRSARCASSLLSRFSMLLARSTFTSPTTASPVRISCARRSRSPAGASFGSALVPHPAGRLTRDRRLVAVGEEDRVIAEAPDLGAELLELLRDVGHAAGRQEHEQPLTRRVFEREPHQVVPARPGRGRRVHDRRVGRPGSTTCTPLSARGRAAPGRAGRPR